MLSNSVWSSASVVAPHFPPYVYFYRRGGNRAGNSGDRVSRSNLELSDSR